ncbi:MAG: glycine--tRNA ligase subunit beta [Coriobacteriia bacterium]|nr:glycine--tRNA ligase subunit beta [Coriobacteriia bacterium]MCL2536980.1 glycine--tRNA ligase subunit beta [Coriobacteriia bacterium]
MEVKPYTSDLLFEIGVEEMPSAPLNAAHLQLEELAEKAFEQARIGYADMTVYSTPRRLALLIKGVEERSADMVQEYKGPSKNIAYADDGTPTKALEGFARGKGVELADCELRELDGVEYIYAVKQVKGQKVQEVLPGILEGLITGLDWPKKQRWGRGDESFIRPVRWILAMLGADVIALKFGQVESGDHTYGHRFLSPKAIPIAAMREYKNVLRGNKVIVDQDKRKELILAEVERLSQDYGSAQIPEKMLAEVVNLVEYPNGLLCSFDEDFLRVPREILEYAMNSHQRYFAIERADGTLDNHFVVISNGDPAFDKQISAGHESVIRARLADAAFFYDEDLKAGLDGWKTKLDSLLFQKKLGTLADKTARIERLVDYLSSVLDVPKEDAANGLRAAALAKADLTSHTVVEFTELQGVMGSYYALAQGESQEVADAIAGHYLPRFSGDDLPGSLPAQLVSIADKTDTIVGIIAAGFAPKGTSDPYGLRRCAIGVLRIVMDVLPLDISKLIDASIATMPAELMANLDSGELKTSVEAYFKSRTESMLRERGASSEVVSAVLAVAAALPADAALRAKALQDFLDTGDAWINLSTAYVRAKNLSDREVGVAVDASLLGVDEQAFYDALTASEPRMHEYLAQATLVSYQDYLNTLASMRAAVDSFFEKVMIMDEDPALRKNRLALLNVFIALIEPFADFRRLPKQKDQK